MYDARLSADSSTQLLWRCEVRLNLGRPVDEGYAGVTLAYDLVSRLLADGVVAPCDEAPRPPAQDRDTERGDHLEESPVKPVPDARMPDSATNEDSDGSERSQEPDS